MQNLLPWRLMFEELVIRKPAVLNLVTWWSVMANLMLR